MSKDERALSQSGSVLMVVPIGNEDARPATIDDVTNWLVRRPITELAVAYRRIAEEIEAQKVMRDSSRDEGDE